RRPAWRKGKRIPSTATPQGAKRASESRLRAGVRALIVAVKPGNAGERRGAGRWRREGRSMRKETGDIALGLKPPERVSTLMRARRTAGLDNTDADGANQAGAFKLAGDAMTWTVSPLRGKTTDWRARCGRSARPVRREGASKPIDAPYPYHLLRKKVHLLRKKMDCRVKLGQ